jgi:hypothetical protein
MHVMATDIKTAERALAGDNNWKNHAAAISATWSKRIDAIFETGRMLIAAREGPNKLTHGSFQAMVALKLPFGPRVAQLESDSVLVRGPDGEFDIDENAARYGPTHRSRVFAARAGKTKTCTPRQKCAEHGRCPSRRNDVLADP